MSSNTVYDFTARTIEGGERTLSDYRGKVLLVVNVASECGFTPQYEGLEALHERFLNLVDSFDGSAGVGVDAP